MAVSKDLVAASATPLVLSILRRAPSYGYAIIKEVRALSGGALEWTDGMLYPVLHRLERDGFIESYEDVSETGRARRYYRVKGAGLKELEARRKDWLAVNAALAAAWEG